MSAAPSTRPGRLLLLALLLIGGATARADAPPAEHAADAHAPAASNGPARVDAPVLVHDHVGLMLHVGEGKATAQERARAASRALRQAIDEQLEGAVVATPEAGGVGLSLAGRRLLLLTAADAEAAGGTSLEAWAPAVATELDGFLSRERRRAWLLQGVLRLSLGVLATLIGFLLVQAWRARLKQVEEKLERGDAALPEVMHLIGLDEERRRGWAVLTVTLLRHLSTALALLAAAVFALSLFEATHGWRDALLTLAAQPVLALSERVGRALPQVLGLLIIAVVVQSGWRATAVQFERAVRRSEPGKRLNSSQSAPLRLIANIGLVLGALLGVPLLLGLEGSALTALGLVATSALALALLPVGFEFALGATALLRDAWPVGSRIRLLEAPSLAGEVMEVSFAGLLLRTPTGEVLIPHGALWRRAWVREAQEPWQLALQLPVALAQLPALQLRLSAALEAAGGGELRLLGHDGAQARFEASGTAPDLAGAQARQQALLGAVEGSR